MLARIVGVTTTDPAATRGADAEPESMLGELHGARVNRVFSMPMASIPAAVAALTKPNPIRTGQPHRPARDSERFDVIEVTARVGSD